MDKITFEVKSIIPNKCIICNADIPKYSKQIIIMSNTTSFKSACLSHEGTNELQRILKNKV